MALGFTSLGSRGDTNARSAFTCEVSRAPDADTLVLVSVLASDTGGTVVEPTSVVGTDMVFSIVTSSVTYNPITVGSQTHNLSVWRSMSAAPSSSLITATFPNATTGCDIQVTEVSGVSTSGTSGANAVGQSATSRVGLSASLEVVGPSATSTANGWFSCHGRSTTGDVSVLDNWVKFDDVTYATPNAGLASAYTLLSTGTRSTWTTTGTENVGGIIVEIVLDNPAVVSVVTTPFKRPLRVPQAPPIQSGITGLVTWAQQVARQLNSEGYISLFSGTNPNTSGFTGLPGNLLVNIGSDSTTTRLWTLGGGITSIDTNDWHPVRIG